MNKRILIEGYQPTRQPPKGQQSPSKEDGPPPWLPLPKTTSSVQLPKK